MTKKIKVILTCFKQTSYEDYTHFFKTVEIEVPYNKGEAVTDRLNEQAITIEFKGDSYRLNKREM